MDTATRERIEILTGLGWSGDVARFLVERVNTEPDDDRSIAVRRRLFGERIRSKRKRYSSRPKAVIPNDLRWQVWERDNFTCQHCGVRRNLSVDHITPESQGGSLALSNLQTLCVPCNSRKGSR